VAQAVDTHALVRGYLTAKRAVIDHGHIDEVIWQAEVATVPVTAASFTREAAWVVLNAGMRESVVRGLFGRLATALFEFDPRRIVENPEEARDSALLIFAHRRKIEAIVQIAQIANSAGTRRLRQELRDPEPFLRALPYIGPITWRHLAKNLGADVAKHDRHLVRLSAAAGRPSVDEVCAEIAEWTGDPTSVVDVVLWRWALIHAQKCGRACDGVPVGWRRTDARWTSGSSLATDGSIGCGRRLHLLAYGVGT
jgi:hypothetical protein